MAHRLRLVALLGAALVALELVLRGRADVHAQVAGQLVAFALFAVAVLLSRRGIGPAGVLVVLVVAIGMRAAAFEPGASPPLTTDVNRYAWDARVLADGVNPYRYAPTDPRLRALRDERVWSEINLPTWRTIYPPAAEASFAAARGVFGHGLRATTWLFLAAEAATVALLLLVLRRARMPLELVLVYAWHPLVVSEVAANGHVDALAALAVAALLAAWQVRRFTLAGAAVAFGALVKFWPALLVPALARRGGRRFVGMAIALAVLAYLPFLSVGTGVVGSVLQLDHRLRFGSLAPPLIGALGAHATHVVLGAVLVAVVGAVAVREHRTVEQVAGSLLLVLGTLLVTLDYLQPWYAIVFVPALVVARAPGWLWFTGAVPLLYLYDATTGTLEPWVRPVLYGPLLVAAGVALLRRRRREVEALPPLPARTRVAAVVPALDEAQALPALLAELPRELLDEVIVVDGGSRDGTPEAARASGARVVVERRRGYGRACATGAASTNADVIVFLDGDGSDDPAFVPAVVEPVLAGRAALALGARRSAERGALLAHQRAGNTLVAALVRVLYGVRLHDVPPLRAVRRDVLERLALSEMTYGWPTEMIVKAARDGIPLAEVPVRSRARRGGVSKIAGRLWPSACAGARMLAVVARHA